MKDHVFGYKLCAQNFSVKQSLHFQNQPWKSLSLEAVVCEKECGTGLCGLHKDCGNQRLCADKQCGTERVKLKTHTMCMCLHVKKYFPITEVDGKGTCYFYKPGFFSVQIIHFSSHPSRKVANGWPRGTPFRRPRTPRVTAPAPRPRPGPRSWAPAPCAASTGSCHAAWTMGHRCPRWHRNTKNLLQIRPNLL